jgi:AcrR family transcriptional regulator
MREIAQTAGYTTGAIYTYFATKEELYAEVLRDSLHALHASVSAATQAASEPQSAAALRSLWAFYEERPADFELGFYLHGGVRPAGLNKDLDDELNGRFNQVMALIGDGLIADDLTPPAQAHHTAVVHATWVFGLLLMTKTGRTRSVREDPAALLDSYLTMVAHQPSSTPTRKENR